MATENYKLVPYNQETTGKVDLAMVDEDGDAIELAAITSIELTLVELAGGTIVNSRQKQDVLNDNNCVVTDGLIVWSIQKEDTAIVNVATPIGDRERHLAIFTIAWNDGDEQTHAEVVLDVRNLHSVPQVGA